MDIKTMKSQKGTMANHVFYMVIWSFYWFDTESCGQVYYSRIRQVYGESNENSTSSGFRDAILEEIRKFLLRKPASSGQMIIFTYLM